MTDLTKDDVTGTLWRFTIPLIVSVAFQQLYNICDSIIAGRFAGEAALAAVGASYPITMIFMAFAVGCNIGASVIISQFFGSGKLTRMKTAVNTSLIMVMGLSFVLLGVGMGISDMTLKLLDTPKDIFSDGSLYLKIYVLGLPFLFLYNISSGIFTALGDSKTPLYFLIFSSVANIALDLLFVAVFHWGVAGVGWATFIAQGVASVLSLAVMIIKLKKTKCNGKPKIFDVGIFARLVTITVPSILQQSFISVGNLFIQSIVNDYGSSTVAGYSAAIKLNTFAIMVFSAIGNAMSSFTAQNIGARQLERVRKGLRSLVLIAACFVALFSCGYFFLHDFFLKLFMDSDASSEALSVGKDFLTIASPFYAVIGFKLVCDGVLRGGGIMRYFIIATFSDLILRVVLSFVFSDMFGSVGIWMSWPVGWTVSAIVSLVFYLKNVWVPKELKSKEKDMKPS